MGRARIFRSSGCSTVRKRESSGERKKTRKFARSVRLELGTSRQRREVFLERGNRDHVPTLAFRLDNDSVGNESLHATLQRRTSLLADSATARLCSI